MLVEIDECWPSHEGLHQMGMPGCMNNPNPIFQTTGCVISADDLKEWSERPDLNRRPPHPQCGALPGCATLRHE